MRILWDTQFCVYHFDKDRERKSETGNDKIGDFVDFMVRYHHYNLSCCLLKNDQLIYFKKIGIQKDST